MLQFSYHFTRENGSTFAVYKLQKNKIRFDSSTYFIITAETVVYAVLKATSQTNAEGRFLIPYGSEAPKWISMQLRNNKHVGAETTQTKLDDAATNTWHVTYV